MRTLARALPLALLLLLAGCVEEHDASLREDGATVNEAPADTARATPPPSSLVASLTEWNVALTHAQVVAGTVSIDVQNNGTEVHALVLERAGQEWRTERIEAGDAITMSVVLSSGTYDVYCPIASGGEAHVDRGMKTTLQVR